MSSRRDNRGGIAVLGTLCFCLAFVSFVPARAFAFTDNPAWTVSVVAAPANFAPEDKTGKDHYNVVITNTGDAPTDGNTVTIIDALPAHLALGVEGITSSELLSNGALSCTELTCTFSGVVPAGGKLMLEIPVDAEPKVGALETNRVIVSGGGAEEVSVSTPTAISSSFPGWGIAPGSFSTTLSNTQAGAHADLATSFYFNTDAEGNAEGQLKDVVVNLPVGFAGDPATIPTCTAAELDESSYGNACPLSAQVGTITVRVGFPAFGGFVLPVVAPVYNMQRVNGEVARLGFNVGVLSSNVIITIRPGDDGLTATAPNLEQGTLQVLSSELTVWGVPADPSHNLMRGTVCEADSCNGPDEVPAGSHEFPLGNGVPSPIPSTPFLSNPTQCAEAPLTATLKADSWQQREAPPREAFASLGPMTGCERLGFDPGLLVQATSALVESPTGLDVNVTLPQTYSDSNALATSHLRNAVVTLPAGMTLNPSAGEGLGDCTTTQYEAEGLQMPVGKGCPGNSSLGTVTIHTPVLPEEATGSVFLAQPYANQFGSLLAIYVIARIPNRGVIIKLKGKVTPNESTGQLVTTFEENPQLPFDKFTLSFRPGEAAPLVTPPACGGYEALGEFTSWSEPGQLLSVLSPAFPITQGVSGGTCPSGGVPPFAPHLISGTLSNSAGSYSPFYLRIIRNDGEQEITKFSTVMPPGVTGNLSGIPFCPEADIEAARIATGTGEVEHPSCPVASEIGHTVVGAGVGGVLAQTPGKVYLAGPYHGAPLSIVSVTSATVGPFDLGTVVIRFALRINPITAQVEVDGASSDPIPHIIRGVVVHVRDIRVYINRPSFIINPTNCNPMRIAATITGAGADPSNPADQAPVSVGERFQAADCANLAFKPTLKVSTSGRTSRAEGASLTFKLTYPNTPQGSEANIARFKVELPKRLPSRLQTLQKACVAATFEANPANCPATSVVGHAKAITPTVPVPLEGPAYFVSHGGEAFPSLIIVLQGYGITVDLVSTTFINKHGITSGTVKAVPDVPVGSFELTLPEGPHSALAAPHSLCKGTLKMPTEFLAQNGDAIHQNTTVKVTNCPKRKAARKAHGRTKRS